MSDIVISIARDYNNAPAGRYPADGPYNGQRFREEFLLPKLAQAIERRVKLVVSFDEADSFSSSFLEEAFGGLIRARRFSPAVVDGTLVLQAGDPVYSTFVADAVQYMREASKRGERA